MNLTLLLDLDDTLLKSNIEAFIPAYFQALAKELTPHVAPEVMSRALMAGTRQMMKNDDFSRTLEDVFAAEFYPQLGVSKKELEPVIDRFYDNIFPTLSGLTTTNPQARPFIEWAFSQGHRVVIATDPLFPRKATYHRIRWAGFDPEQFELVSTFEHFHFTKTHPAYYAEMLGRLGWPDAPVIMVGNDMVRDIVPAKMLGLATWHIVDGPASQSGPEADFNGDLQDLRRMLESTDLEKLIPSFKSKESVLGILLSTPAVMKSLVAGLGDAELAKRSKPDEWNLAELFCHMRDTEREIHHIQIRLMMEQSEPFIPRPDTGVWASQRDYLHESGLSALSGFVSSRQETMKLLKEITEADWARKARHAIFGPTNFLEVISFMADHDRLHIQQALNLLKQGK
jgi:FMN phosphatase YigB (HAD superfamily)